MNCKCMELAAAGWCTMSWLRFDQTVRNITSGDMGILFVVIQLGVTRLKKTRSCISWICLKEWGRRGTAI